MFNHVMVGANDLDQSKTFYDAVLGTLGIKPGFSDDKGRTFWLSPGGVFAISKPIDGDAACHANGGTIGFKAESSEQVDAWHAAGVAAGGTSCEDQPGLRTGGPASAYMGYLRDPAGNKLCVFCQLPG